MKFKYFLVHQNTPDKLDTEFCWIEVKVTLSLKKISFTAFQTVRSFDSILVQAPIIPDNSVQNHEFCHT